MCLHDVLFCFAFGFVCVCLCLCVCVVCCMWYCFHLSIAGYLGVVVFDVCVCLVLFCLKSLCRFVLCLCVVRFVLK